jgi:two-component system, NtrC family, sensor kinase
MVQLDVRATRSGDRRRNFTARPSFILFAILLAALAIAVVVIGQFQDRNRQLEAARREAATLARALEEQTASVIWATDFALRALADRLEHEPGLTEHDPALEASMRRQLGQLPGVRALFVVGPDGFITQDSDPDTPRRNLRDRDYFRAHAGGPNPNLFVGMPLRSRSVATWFVGLSRRIDGPRGAFRGVAVAALETHYFETLYADLDLDPESTIMLTMRNGILVARTPPAADQVGRPLTSASLGRRLTEAVARPGGGGTARAGTIDEQDRIFGYRALRAHPLVVIVGLSKAQALQPWRRGAIRITGLAAVALCLAFLILWLAMRHAAREEAVKARIAQAANLEAIGRATSGIAHDFNNILQILRNSLFGLQMGNPDADAMTFIDLGLDATQRGRGVVAQLLTVARPHPLDLELVDVSALVRDMKPLLTSAVGDRIRIETDLADGLPLCRTDPSRLEAAILNLVVNAKDAVSPGRHGHVRIRTALSENLIRSGGSRPHAADDLVCISVADNGIGMTEEVRQQILEPFFTTKGEAGTGLGLAQVDMFMQETGGKLRIESECGVGTEVQLLLPSEESAGALDPDDADDPHAADGKQVGR